MFKIKTDCDAGGVLIGNKEVQILVANGFGDCQTTVVVLDPNEGDEIPEKAHYFGIFSGTDLNVYHYDCGPQFGLTAIPDGRYSAHFLDGTVWLHRFDDPLEMDEEKERKRKISWTLAWDIFELAEEHDEYSEIISKFVNNRDDRDASRAEIQKILLEDNESVCEIVKILCAKPVKDNIMATQIADQIADRIVEFREEYVLIRYVYPIYQHGKKALLIQCECEDGYCWDFSPKGISNYLKENVLEMESVEWQIKLSPTADGFMPLTARNIKEWFDKFNALHVEFEKTR